MSARFARLGAGCRWGSAGGLCCAVVAAAAGDWPQYRGPTHNGVSPERINKQWTGSVTNPVWRVHLTNGLTSLTVGGGRAFTQVAGGFDEEGYPHQEFCVALSTTNGAVLWSTEVESRALPQSLYPNGGVGETDDGPRSTPALAGGSVYVLTSYLKLHRLNATNGTVIWSTNLVAGFGGSVIPWQNAASPVIENGLVFVNANAPTASLMAFNATNGALVWRSQNEGLTHTTPVLATIHGVRQLIFATQSGLVSLHPQTGAGLWKFAYPFGYNTSIGASPVVHEDRVFLSAVYGMGAFCIQIVLTNSTLVPVQRWRDAGLQTHWATPVCHRGALFGPFTPDSADAQLRCIDLASGATRWSVNGFGRGSVLLVGTNLIVVTERGDLVLAAASTNAYTELRRFRAIPSYLDSGNKCWNALALSDGQLYVRSTAYAARFDLSLPDLKLDPPQLAPLRQLQFTIRTVNGTPVASNRLAGLEVRASTNAALATPLWPKLTNALVLADGVVRVTDVDTALSRRFFIVSEPARSDPLIPPLKLDPPQLAPVRQLLLTIRTANGTPLDSNRLDGVEVRASTNAALAPALWPKLTNALVLSHGVVRVSDVDATSPRRFFIVSEPP